VAHAAAIAQADGLRHMVGLSDQMQIFTRSDDCTRDDRQRDYFILARCWSCSADQQVKTGY
jgi:hypothetical protein